MRKKWRQKVMLILALAGLAGTIGGCQGKEETEPEAKSSQPAVTAESEEKQEEGEISGVSSSSEDNAGMLSREEILIRDPYVMPYDGKYYLYGTDGDTAFSGEMDSFHVYVSEDLENWEGPYTIYENDGSYWADAQYWAPEVYEKDGKFYLYGSMGGSSRENKGIALFQADDPLGPFEPVSDGTITPEDVDAIDATLYQEDGKTYMVYSHGKDGIFAVELNDSWDAYAGEPFKLFDVSGCGWATEAFEGMVLNDGPALYTTESGQLICFFSTMSENGYRMGYAVSDNGSLTGNWECSTNQIQTATDGGHCMIFTNLDGETMVGYHAPNENSHPVFQYLAEDDGGNILFTDTAA